ncbi:hypothetical protein [Pyxidicoccus xibeiensis]|uniref:hypothetical protein n=1 Tax=Pyxidicoccus xibeiensis TaxID=2906759 RepID=UPI0020A72BC6|nr:hypothetical protein [Pyxidicoccus xibeiensis]MCP3141424.1 hypothetical protein [Pyxidicoccus xibeiensis]
MDSFFTSLNKRQSMLLLTAVTFGGQESLEALEHLPEEEGALLRHRAQEIFQIPRDKRIPALVQEIKRLVKDRRGQLWSAEPERLAALLQRERGALMEVVLRALPGTLAEAVRAHLPPPRVKLTREVRPQVLDIVRWKLEEALAREAGQQAAGFKFSDVLQLQQRELLTVCDRLGARVLGPAMAGLPDAEREAFFEPLPPDLKLLAGKSVAANAPRKLPEEDARAQLELHDAKANPAGAIRSAGVQRLARACVAQSPEFAARMLEKYRGEFGGLLAKWVREERIRPTARGDGGRTDIVMDLERLATRGLIERPVRLATPPPPRQSAVLPPPPGARKAASAVGASVQEPRASMRGPAASMQGPAASMRGPAASMQGPAASMQGPAVSMQGPAVSAQGPAVSSQGPAVSGQGPAVSGQGPAVSTRGPAASTRGPAVSTRGPSASLRAPSASMRGPAASLRSPSVSRDGAPAVRRDVMAERAARNAGAVSSRAPSRAAPSVKPEGAPDGSSVHRVPPRRESVVAGSPQSGSARREPGGPEPRPSRPVRPDPDGARIGPPPSRLGMRGAPRRPEEPDAAPEPARERSRVGGEPEPGRERSRVASEPEPGRERSRVAGESSRVQRPPEELSRSSRVRPRPESLAEPREDPEGSRVFRSRSSASLGALRGGSQAGDSAPERPPRVLTGRAPTASGVPAASEGTSVQRRPRSTSGTDRPVPPGAGGRGPKGGTR